MRMKRQWQIDIEEGKTIYEWNGFSPFYVGCFYGNSVCLGGEEKFRGCYDFFSGIGDVEWWIVSELEKLTEIDKKELLRILKRNKRVHYYISTHNLKIKEMASELQLEGPHIIYRLGNRKILSLLSSKNLKETYEQIKVKTLTEIKPSVTDIEEFEELIEFPEDCHENQT